MRRGQPTKLGTVLLIIVVLAVVIGGIVWVGKALFGGESGPTEANAGQKLLDEPTAMTGVRMSVRGPVSASETHYSIIMTITANHRQITTYRGYDGSIVHDEKLNNNMMAFLDLTAALSRAGFMKENGNTEPSDGVCATGQLIYFEIFEYVKNEQDATVEKSVKTLWTTECEKITGNFGGLLINVINLFKAQIPNSQAIIDNAKEEIKDSNQNNYNPGLGSW